MNSIANSNDFVQALGDRDLDADMQSLSARLDAFKEKSPEIGPTPIDSEGQQPTWEGDSLVPEVPVEEFNAQVLRSAMATSGALIVRGFMSSEAAISHKAIIDQVLGASAPSPAGSEEDFVATTAYNNTPEVLKSLITPSQLAKSRHFQRQCGSAMAVEASSVAEQLLDLYQQRNLKQIIGDYLGEPPCLSAKKWVLRQSVFPINPFGWHQDGAFMGAGINSINMWIPLDLCGNDTGAPGLDVLATRLREVVKPGTEGAAFEWSVSEDDITRKYGRDMIVSPTFNAGDAFFFDHFYLHRTQYKESFDRHRYAIETWFFGSRNFPKNQIPLAW